MKHKGSTMEYSKERIRDLMRAYDEYISSCGHINMPNVYSAITDMPSRRFWVSEIRAALVISSIMRLGEKSLKGMLPTKKEMYKEIYRRVIALKDQHPEESVSELCARVVDQPAPKFYLTPGSVKIMVCKARRQWRIEKLKRVQRLFLE